MIKTKNLKYILLPAWRITQQNKSLIVSGGADARYEIDLETNKASFFGSLKTERAFSRNDLSASEGRILEQLVTAEIIVPILEHHDDLKVCLLGDDSRLGLDYHSDIEAADLLLIVRSYSTFADLLKKIKYQNITKPHLFVDLAFHHTVSFGPLVFPGETACIACLQGRISSRWGDDELPPKPKSSQVYYGVARELISTELNRIMLGDTSMTNKTISWNYQDRVIKTNQLLKVPICPVCRQNTIDRSGVLALPWGKDESASNSI